MAVFVGAALLSTLEITRKPVKLYTLEKEYCGLLQPAQAVSVARAAPCTGVGNEGRIRKLFQQTAAVQLPLDRPDVRTFLIDQHYWDDRAVLRYWREGGYRAAHPIRVRVRRRVRTQVRVSPDAGPSSEIY